MRPPRYYDQGFNEIFFTQNKKKASEIIYGGCPKFKTYSVFMSTGRVYDFDVFQIP